LIVVVFLISADPKLSDVVTVFVNDRDFARVLLYLMENRQA
jgi:hypothetical protein